MVVQNLKREGGRPERERESVERFQVVVRCVGEKGMEGLGDAGGEWMCSRDCDCGSGVEMDIERAMGAGWRIVGRRSNFVEGVFWSLERAFLGRWGVEGDVGTEDSRAGGGDSGECEDVGDPTMGDCARDEREGTYECFISGRFVISSLARSSWCTAMLKRRQKLGSRTTMVEICGEVVRMAGVRPAPTRCYRLGAMVVEKAL